MNTCYIRAYLYASLCAVLSAGTILLIKLINGSIDSLSLGFIRLTLTALSITPYALWHQEYKKIIMRDLWYLGAIGLSGYYLNTALYFAALLYAPALNVALVNVLIPILTVVAAYLFFGHTVSRVQLGAFALAAIGITLVITDGTLDWSILTNCYGEFFALGSSTCWVLYTMAVWGLNRKYSPFFIVWIGSLIGSILMGITVFLKGDIATIWPLLIEYWPALGYIGLLGTTTLYLLYIASIDLIGPNLTALIMYSLRPVLVAILAFYILGAHTSYYQIAGGVLICYALYLVTRCSQNPTAGRS